MEKISAGRSYVLQQDSAPAYTNHSVQNWLSDSFDMFWSEEFWPHNSLDLNSSNYYIWSVVERASNKSSHSNVNSLKATIMQTFQVMDREQMKQACSRFRPRMEAVIEAVGDYIERELFRSFS